MRIRDILLILASSTGLLLSACRPMNIPSTTATPLPVLREAVTSPPSPSRTSISTLLPISSPPTTATIINTATPNPSLIPTHTPSRPDILPAAQPAALPYFQPGDPIVLDEIHMVSTSEGWAISGPFVLATADGGHTWRQVTPPAALPEGTWKATSGPHVLETSDRGQTWQIASEPELSYYDQVTVYGAFLDGKSAWVILSAGRNIPMATRVWHTNDGGESWTPSQPLHHDVFADSHWVEFAVLDTNTLWLVVCGTWVAAGQAFEQQLFRSDNGGFTWVPQDSSVDDTTSGMDQADNPEKLVFVNRDHGWLIFQTLHAYFFEPPQYAVTQNGGFDWEIHTFPPPADAPDLFDQQFYCEPYQLNLLSSQSARLLVGCFCGEWQPETDCPMEPTSYLYASDNGGMTWEIHPLPEGVLISNISSTALTFFDADTGLLFSRRIYHTETGGQTWTHIKTVNWDGQFSFVDEQHGWAVARTDGEIALVSTMDGGYSWAEITPTIGE